MNNLTKHIRKLAVSFLVLAVLFTNLELAFGQQVTTTDIAEINQQNNTIDVVDGKHAVSDTAYITLYWLASAGNAKAKLILEQADKELLAELGKAHDFDKIKVVNKEYQKLRHDSLNSYALANGYQVVMDLACGYSPRGLELSEAKITYIGGDFTSVIQSMQKFTDCCASVSQKSYLKYKVVDVTDQEQMLAATSDIDGPVCIMTEGLFMYLNKEQTAATFNNIGTVLKNKGGCFITQDFSTKQFVTAVAEALYPHKGKDLYKISANLYNDTSDGIMNTEFGADASAINALLKKEGLRYKKVPLSGKNELTPLEGLDAAQEKRMQRLTAKKYMWVIMR